MKNLHWMITLLLALALSGCMTPDMLRVSNTLAAPEFATTPGVPQAAAAQKTESALEGINQGTFTLALIDVELKQALAILSKDSPVPIIAEPGATGRVTVNIRNKPLGDLLVTMLRPLGYSATIEGGMIVVGPPRLVTRSFVINYLKDKRVSNSVTNASISAGSGGSGDGSSSGNSQGNVSVTTSGSSDYWAETVKGLEAIVYGPGKKDSSAGNRMVTNQLAGVIYVTAPTDTMDIVSSFLTSIEQEVKRQVLIQAHIVEVDLNDSFKLGINWDAILQSASKSVSFRQVAHTDSLANSFILDIKTPDFNLLLDAFKEQGDVNMLSSPKISTLNNQKAVIKLTTKEVTWVQSTLRDSDGKVTEIISTPQIDEVGLFLDVTPNISDRGSITMQVHPSITEVQKTAFSPGAENTSRSSKPVITVREIDTMVDIQSGQTMVIGGLISDKFTAVKRGIPLLGDIPYLGWLFSNYSQEKRKTELVIFITPYVLDNNVIEDIRKEHENRLWGSEGINRLVESTRN